MKTKSLLTFSTLAILFLALSWAHQPATSTAAPLPAVQMPVLKWQHGGCYSSWCETGWYSSPAVADLDGDGSMEVIASAYSIVALDGATGALEWRAKSGHDRSTNPDSVNNVGRTWPGIVVADVDGDTELEIVTAHGSGYVSVYNQQGYFEAGWPQRPVTNELRGLVVFDLDNDGTMEIVVTAARGSKTNSWVLEHNGATRSGWPQLSNDSGYAWGVYNDNAAVGDLDGDGSGEIVVPSDVHYICAYEPNGVQIPANSIYGSKAWGAVGVHVDHAVDLRGYANCGSEHRPNFADSAASMIDVNGDGSREVVVVGNNYNCGTSPYTSLYHMPYIFNADRSRWSGNGYDWTAIPTPDGSAAPISEDYSVIESDQPNPVVADLDGNGLQEILYASYDGRVHAYWPDKTEHGNWPYSVYQASEGFYRFASEPLVADLDNNGQAEVIFASWVQKGTNQTGKLHILDYLGNVLHEVNLPSAFGSPNWNGTLAAPTLANIDADTDLELVLNTAHSGVVAYDLPGTANANILWGTGRNNYQRSGSIVSGTLAASTVSAQKVLADPGDRLTITIRLNNPGPLMSGVTVTNALPANLTYAGNLTAPSGSYSESGGVITWSGDVPQASPIDITFDVAVNPALIDPTTIVNTAQIDDGQGTVLQRQATIIVNGQAVHLPLVIKTQ